MPNLNPDFRGADEVVKPDNAEFGWATNSTEAEAILLERRGEERLQAELPAQMVLQDGEEPLQSIMDAWNAFQQSKGRFPGSYDWSILDEFVHGKPLIWRPQIIGSCVESNTKPGWVARLQYQIVFLGNAMEYLGRDDKTSNNFAPYGPYNYGAARKRVNLRGGDGLFCEGMVESLLKDGVLPCNNPDLIALNKRLGVDRPQDYFEPQNAAVYRQWGNWQYIDQFAQYADYRLNECPYIKGVDELLAALKVCKPTFVCSMLAIRKIGQHKDGFAIHGRNPSDQWAHNMQFRGILVASDGAMFIRFSNESWGSEHMYTVPVSEVDDWFRRRNLTAAAIGHINGPSSSPPVFGV